MRKAQADGSIVAPLPIDVLEAFVDPTCDACALHHALDLHDRYRQGEDVGQLDKVTQFLFDSTGGKAMVESMKVDVAKLEVLTKATAAVSSIESMVDAFPDTLDIDFGMIVPTRAL